MSGGLWVSEGEGPGQSLVLAARPRLPELTDHGLCVLTGRTGHLYTQSRAALPHGSTLPSVPASWPCASAEV